MRQVTMPGGPQIGYPWRQEAFPDPQDGIGVIQRFRTRIRMLRGWLPVNVYSTKPPRTFNVGSEWHDRVSVKLGAIIGPKHPLVLPQPPNVQY